MSEYDEFGLPPGYEDSQTFVDTAEQNSSFPASSVEEDENECQQVCDQEQDTNEMSGKPKQAYRVKRLEQRLNGFYYSILYKRWQNYTQASEMP